MRRTAVSLVRRPLTFGTRGSISLGSSCSVLSTRNYTSGISPQLIRLADEASHEVAAAPTGEELANSLRSHNHNQLANAIQQLEADLAKLRQPQPTPDHFAKDYGYVHEKLRKDYATPTSTVGKQLQAFLVKYADTKSTPETSVKRVHTIRTLIQIDKESDLGKKLEFYRSLPQFEDPAKQKALDQALASTTDASKKEQVVKDQLNWKDSERKAADLKRRYPDFKELHQALDYFPPLVDVLGEPSEFSRRFAEIALNGQDPSEVNVVDFWYQARLPSADKLQNIDELVALAKKEKPSDPNLGLIDAVDKITQSDSEYAAAILKESKDWAQKRLQWANEMFRTELQTSEDMKQMDVDEVLYFHPDWAEAIEDDIANYRWDPSIPKHEYEKAWKEYLSHWRHA